MSDFCPHCRTRIPVDLPIGYHSRCKGCSEYEYCIVHMRTVPEGTYEWSIRRQQGLSVVIHETCWIRSAAPVNQQPPPDAAEPLPTAPVAPKLDKLSVALVLLRKHPDWTDKAIAKEAGCSPPYLSKNPTYRAARKAIKGLGQETQQRSRNHRGSDMDEYADG